jgi:hypothetical protein
MSYADFLARKERRHQSTGINVTPDQLSPHLHDWQARITATALQRGRCGVFADTGLGKTRMQVEWSRLAAERSLILAPLSVARQTVREAERIGVDVRYVRSPDQVGGGISITNYEMADRFDPAMFGAVALDELRAGVVEHGAQHAGRVGLVDRREELAAAAAGAEAQGADDRPVNGIGGRDETVDGVVLPPVVGIDR